MRFIDADGRNATAALGGLIVESWNFVNGDGFNGGQILGALKDGYNGQGAGIASAAWQDATTIVPIPTAKIAQGAKLVGKGLKAASKLIKSTVSKVAAKNGDKFRRTAQNLSEKLTMDEAMGGAGRKIIDSLSDPKFKGMQKWQHTHKNPDGTTTVIHYVRDPKTGKLTDFKYKE